MAKNLDERTCSECGKTKSLSEFPTVNGRSGKTYHQKVCKACRREYESTWRHEHLDDVREYRQKYYARHRETILARVLAWQHANRERKLEYQRSWYLANQEDRLKKQQEWYEKNKDKVTAYRKANRKKIAERMKAWRERNEDVIKRYQQEWREANVEHVRAYARRYRQERPEIKLLSQAKRRAAARGSVNHFTLRDVQEIFAFQFGECPYCGTNLSNAFEIDHIVPLSRGGSNGPENIQLLCSRRNRKKHAKTHDEFLAWSCANG